MNEHIAHFQRWSNCYLMYSHSNFDRIVKEAVKRQEKPSYDDAFSGYKLGQIIRIKLPKDFVLSDGPKLEIIKEREPSFFRCVLASLTPILKGRLP